MKYEEQKIYKDTKKLHKQKVSGIVFGSETCVYKALNEEVISTNVINMTNIRYVTPMIPEGYIEKMYRYIKKLVAYGELKVTFNDYGLLYRCRDLIQLKVIIPVLGRVLTRSIIDCPSYSFILQNESESLRKAIVGTTWNHESKLLLLKAYGIREIEVNMIYDESFCFLKQNGILLTAHSENILLSVGKSCFASRYMNKPIPYSCEEKLCDKKIEVELIKKWKKGFYIDNKDLRDKLYIYGNSVFKKVQEDSLKNVDDFFDIVII